MRGAWLLAGAQALSAACLPYTAAPKNIGDSACVTGKVLKVARSARSGTHFLNFCEDYRNCPFSVVIFAKDLPNVGDVRALEGTTIEVYGKIRNYKGQAEIILSDVRQLRGEAAKLPVLPKHYDVETKGTASAGSMQPASPAAKKKRPSRRETARDPEDRDPQ